MYIHLDDVFDNDAEHLTTEASDNIKDLGEDRDLGAGENIYLVAIVKTAFTDASSDSTMTLTLETDDNEAFASASSVQVIGTFAALAAIGDRLVLRLAPGAIRERYLRVKYTVANGNLTTGKFMTFLAKDIDTNVTFPDAVTIS